MWLNVKAWERIVGKLSFMAKAIYGGRTFLRRVIDLIVRLKQQSRKGSRITKPVAADLHWWLQFMDRWNGEALILDGQKILASSLTSDASDTAVGAVYGQLVIYQVLTSKQRKWHINEKEIFAFLLAIREWGSNFPRKHVKFVPRLGAKLDNTTAMAWINKGTSRSKIAMLMLREICWISAIKGFRITCAHIPGNQNVVADAASRLEFARIPNTFVIKKARVQSLQEIDSIKRLNSI